MSVLRACTVCGVEFEARSSRHRRCGAEACARIAMAQSQARYRQSEHGAVRVRAYKQRKRTLVFQSRTCPVCGEQFTPRASNQASCKNGKCDAQRSRQRAEAYRSRPENKAAAQQRERQRSADPDKRLRRRIRIYNLTPDQFYELLAGQGFRCGACGTTDPEGEWTVDHDHACCDGSGSCGRCVRGLLCRRCNMLEGLLASAAKQAGLSVGDVLAGLRAYLITPGEASEVAA